MATFFSDTRIGFWNASNNYLIGTLTGDVSRSGNTVTLYNMNLSIRATYSSWGSDYYTFTVNGTNTGATVYANGYDMGSYGLNSTSFSVSTTQTSADVGWSTSDGYSGSFTVWFSSGVSSPSTPSVSVQEIYTDGAKFSVSISSYGNPSGEYNRYIEAGILNQNSYGNSYRYSIAYRTTSANIIVNNASSTGSNPLTIRPNTRYWYGGWATNTQANSSTVSGQFVTKAKAAIITPSQIGTDFATFLYSTEADGGYYNKTIQYSIDGGTTWTTIATVSGGSAASGAFTVSNLTAGTRYNLQTRVTTTSGTTNGTVVPFVAKTGLVTAFYGSANNQSVKTIDLYGSVNGESKGIAKLYGPTESPVAVGVSGSIRLGGAGNVSDFDGNTFWSYMQNYSGINWLGVDYVKATLTSGKYYSLDLYYVDGTSRSLLGHGSATDLADYGIVAINTTSGSVGDNCIDLTPITEVAYKTKLVYQGFGHVDYGYGYVEYYTDSGHITTAIATIRSQTELDALGNNSDTWTATVDGEQVANTEIKSVVLTDEVLTLPTGFLRGCTVLTGLNISDSKIVATPDHFLHGCTSFNRAIAFPSTLKRIGDFFLFGCSSYNQQIVLPARLGITHIGSYFLASCYQFNQDLALPSTLTSIGTNFLGMNVPTSGAGAMVGTINVGDLSASIISSSDYSFACVSSTAPMYTTGITIAGNKRAEWLAKFPNGSHTYMLRKLIDAGY